MNFLFNLKIEIKMDIKMTKKMEGMCPTLRSPP